jgi:hypothetical protein
MTALLPRFRTVLALVATLAAPSAWSWGADGHHTTGTLAAQLLQGTPAQAQVEALLGGLTLADAAVWADCAKGIDPDKDYTYTVPNRYPECKVFETPEGIAEMADYVRRNDTNCQRKPKEESCHRQYHYTDVAVQRDHYQLGLSGTRDIDVVAAVAAAIRVLQGEPAPAPFSFKDKREALLVLAHLLGDLHQPLHVGAVYLDLAGKPVDPDAQPLDPATETRGGNSIAAIFVPTNRRIANLHQTWDDIPLALNPQAVDAAWLKQARTVPRTAGPMADWSAIWATGTLKQAAQVAYQGLSYGEQKAGSWSAPLNTRYYDAMQPVKKKLLTSAGARLAQVLRTVWP